MSRSDVYFQPFDLTESLKQQFDLVGFDGLGFRFKGLGLRVADLGFRVQGGPKEFVVEGVEFSGSRSGVV